LLVLLCVLFSCTLDQQPTADNNDTTNNNPTNSSVARVTGVIKDSNGTPMLGVVIVATDATTGRTYSADTGTTGTFTLHVPKGNPMIYAIIDEEGKACGVLCGTLPSGTSSRDVSNPVVSTGIKVNADVALGDIEIPNTPGMIDMTNKAELDAEIVAKIDATTSELIGFTGGAEHGKGDTLQVDGGLFTDSVFDPFGGKADLDGDGLPNVIDADDDGDGIVDDWDTSPYGSEAESDIPEASPVEFTLGFLLDIRENSGVNSYLSATTITEKEAALQRDMRLDIKLNFRDTTAFSNARSVKIYLPSSPPYAEHLEAVEFSSDSDPEASGFATYYFADGSSIKPSTASIPWSNFETDGTDGGYNIPRHLNDQNTYAISLKIPSNFHDLFEVGDVFTVEITYADGSVALYSQMLNYVYGNVTHFTSIAVTNTATPPMTLDAYTDLSFSSNTPNEIGYESTDTHVHFLFTPPKDERDAFIIPDESEEYDIGFRIELRNRPEPVSGSSSRGKARSVGTWNQNRYDDVLSNVEKIEVSTDEIYFIGTVPLDTIKNLVDLEDLPDDGKSDMFDMEYFLNVTEDSYIKNQLTFKASDSPMI
jgi:hypothetical protein